MQIQSTINRVSSITLLVAILLTFFACFFTPKTLEDNFNIGPMIWIYIFTCLGTISLIFTKVTRFEVWSPINLIDILILATVILITARKALLSETLFNDELVSFICLTCLYFVTRSGVLLLRVGNSQIVYDLISSSILTVALISCVYGYLQMTGVLLSNNPYFRVTGSFLNPARYALFLAAITPLCIPVLHQRFPSRSWSKINFYISILTCCFLIVIQLSTNTRAAWLGILAGLTYMTYANFPSKFLSIVKNARIMIAVLLIAGIGAFYLYKFKQQSADGRITIWKTSIRMVEDNPILGVGYGNFKNNILLYQAGYFSAHPNDQQGIYQADEIRYPYNILLQILCEQGILGLGVFLLLLFIAFRYASSRTDEKGDRIQYLKRPSGAGIIVITVSGLFSYPFDVFPVFAAFFTYLGIISGARINRQTILLSAPSRVGKSLAYCVLGAAAIVITYFANDRAKAYRRWKNVTANNNVQEVTKLYGSLINDAIFLDYYSSLLLYNKRYIEAISVIENGRHIARYPSIYLTLAQAYAGLGELEKAEAQYRLADNMVPNRFYSKYLWAEFYYNNGKYENAYELCERILKMQVKVPSEEVTNILLKAQKMKLSCLNPATH